MEEVVDGSPAPTPWSPSSESESDVTAVFFSPPPSPDTDDDGSGSGELFDVADDDDEAASEVVAPLVVPQTPSSVRFVDLTSIISPSSSGGFVGNNVNRRVTTAGSAAGVVYNDISAAAAAGSSSSPSPTSRITAKIVSTKEKTKRWLRRSIGSAPLLVSSLASPSKKVSISEPIYLQSTSNASLAASIVGDGQQQPLPASTPAVPEDGGAPSPTAAAAADNKDDDGGDVGVGSGSGRLYRKNKNALASPTASAAASPSAREYRRKISQTRNRKLGSAAAAAAAAASSAGVLAASLTQQRWPSPLNWDLMSAAAAAAGAASSGDEYDVVDGTVTRRKMDVKQRFLRTHLEKICMDCKCPRDAHDVCHQDWVNVRDRVGFKTDSVNSSKDQAAQLGYAWIPEGLSPKQVEHYMSLLPKDKVPKLGTAGERYRDHQMMMQLPKQDFAAGCCHHLGPEHRRSFDDFASARNDIAFNIATVKSNIPQDYECQECSRVIHKGSLAVITPSYSEPGYRHPGCFVCCECKELLVDLAYCSYEDNIYCERHYAEQLKPRCAACEELIFSGEYTKAMSKDWHSTHFCCWNCDESLTGQRYVLRDDHPYCIKCYEERFANNCEECKKSIGIESKDLSYKDRHWHEACFLCAKCRVSLVDKQFGSKFEKIYCGNCYDAQFASRCDGCGDIFKAGMKKMEYKTRQWHEKCFSCCVCHTPIGTKSFIPREQEIYCTGCYEETFATRCIKCNKIITSGGVTYKNEPWHKECFTCTNCAKSLAGERFTSKNEKPYCAECFGELFAKRCTACAKPITGIGGTRYISFEDRHWHNDCFVCASCKNSLVGKGFITDGEDILCPDCAKQKLM